MPLTHLLYLHGFRSSPQSFKARRMADWLARHKPDVVFWCPQLPPSPRAAMALVNDGIAGWPVDDQNPTAAVMGSSLGGYYATVVSAATGWPAVLLNPAVDPARDLVAHIGELTAFHAPDEPFHFDAAYIDELRAMALPQIQRPERNLAVIAKGDEVLDWCEIKARHEGARLLLLEGSDHGLSDFELHLPHILEFLKLCD